MINHTPPIVVGISGASGAIYGIRLLETLKASGIETHLIISRTAQITITQETDYPLQQVQQLASVVHGAGDFAASISSGSFKTHAMVIAPCSMRSLGEIASGVTTSLLTRAADVTLKEKRRLVLLPRETPLHSIHLRNLLTLSDMGTVIMPPVPAFYHRPTTLDDIINHTVGRTLDLLGIPQTLSKAWLGLDKTAVNPPSYHEDRPFFPAKC